MKVSIMPSHWSFAQEQPIDILIVAKKLICCPVLGQWLEAHLKCRKKASRRSRVIAYLKWPGLPSFSFSNHLDALICNL